MLNGECGSGAFPHTTPFSKLAFPPSHLPRFPNPSTFRYEVPFAVLPLAASSVARTFCGDNVAKLMPEAKAGDHDPLDICVISERPITMSEIILKARIVGGLPLCD